MVRSDWLNFKRSQIWLVSFFDQGESAQTDEQFLFSILILSGLRIKHNQSSLISSKLKKNMSKEKDNIYCYTNLFKIWKIFGQQLKTLNIIQTIQCTLKKCFKRSTSSEKSFDQCRIDIRFVPFDMSVIIYIV